jgi:5-methylcytosine-specific restriction endonuclease McrA
LVAACSACNLQKANRTPKQAGMPLIRKPKKPTLKDLIGTTELTYLEEWLPLKGTG